MFHLEPGYVRVLSFAAANCIVLLGAISLVRLLRLRGLLTNVLAVFTCGFAQIVLSLLFAGAVLQQLYPVTVIVINLALSSVFVVLSFVVRGPLSYSTVYAWTIKSRDVIGETLANRWAFALVVLSTSQVLWLAFLAYLYPPFDFDAVLYHLPTMAAWIQAGKIDITPYTLWSNVYPANTELFYTWLVMFLQSDVLVNIGQLVLALGGMLAVAGIARTVGLNRAHAMAAGCLFFLTPIVLVQSISNYVDVAFASMFLIFFYFALRHIYEPRTAYLSLAGIAAGLAMGMKASGAAYVGIPVLLLVGAYAYRRWLKRDASSPRTPLIKDAAVALFVLAAPVLLLSAYWYLRTWAYYGNPLYPYTLKVAGHVIFAGWGSVQDLIMTPNTPKELLGHPAWQQILLSWFSDPPARAGYYIYDQRMGGFGVQWLYLELPALLLVSAYALWKRRDLFLTLVLPLVVIFLVQPANWWSRYTVFIVAPGAIALALVVERLPRQWIRTLVQAASVLAVLVSILFSTTQGFLAPSQAEQALQLGSGQRTIGALWLAQYAWVDSVPAGSHIGFTGYTTDYWNVYPLFGTHLQNQVIMMQDASASDFLTQVRHDQIDFVMVGAGSAYLKWVTSEPSRFQLLYTSPGGDRIYQVK